MDLETVQEDVDDWVNQYEIGYWTPVEQVAQLAEEVGELSRAVMHLHGPKNPKTGETTEDISGELGDILFDIACLANTLGVDLETVFEQTMEKRYGRDSDRWEKTST